MARSKKLGPKATLALGLFSLLTTTSCVHAGAMGSGNNFEDAQVGLDYVVYQPLNTVGMKLLSFTLAPCNNNHDEAVVANYGNATAHLTVIERSRTYSCSYKPHLAAHESEKTLGKAGSGYLTGTQLTLVTRGLMTTQINAIITSLSTKYPRPKQ